MEKRQRCDDVCCNSRRFASHWTEEAIALSDINNNNNNNNNTYIALIRMRSKRFTSIVLQYDLEI